MLRFRVDDVDGVVMTPGQLLHKVFSDSDGQDLIMKITPRLLAILHCGVFHWSNYQCAGSGNTGRLRSLRSASPALKNLK